MDESTGKPRQVSETFHGTKGLAQRRLNKLKDEVADGDHGGSNSTVGQLLNEYVTQSEARGRAKRTIHEARRSMETTLKPLCALRLPDLTPRKIDQLYTSLADGTGATKGKPLSPSSIRRHHAVLNAALAQGVKWGWLERNPAERATLPETRSTSLSVASLEDARAFLVAAKERNPRFGMLFSLLMVWAIRRGEVCALRWSDLSGSVEAGTAAVHVRRALYRAGAERGEKETKGKRERVIAIDPAVAELLVEWRAVCEQWAAEKGVAPAADAFIVSVLPDGSRPVNPDTLSTAQHDLAKQLGMRLEGRNPFRHFGASEMGDGESGVSPRDAADLLGHSDVSLTLNRYTHSTTERQKRASAILARVIEPVPPAPLSTTSSS